HPDTKTCIYNSDASCQAAYGAAYYDGNQYDGCSCNDGATYNQSSGLCEYATCPAGQSPHSDAGNCIYNSDASCQAAYGAAYYDGNQYDGCSCSDGANFNQESGLCEYTSCPAGQSMHPDTKTCIYNSDASCQAAYGAAYYDGNQYDGCSCNEGATYNQESGLCELPVASHIVVSASTFTIPANGSSTYEFSAWVENDLGEIQEVPMWVSIERPNSIAPGSLQISNGFEGGGDTSVEATYTAPQISMEQKTENVDEIKDQIYVFAMINGERTYKVINAVLSAELNEFQVQLTFEKPGLETYHYNTNFTQGALTGDLHLTDEGEKFPLNGVKISLHIAPTEENSEINLETYSEDGYFFFENLGETGEDDIGDIEMKLNSGTQKMYDKVYQHYEAFKARTNKYGSEDFGAKYKYVADDFIKSISAADTENAQMEIDALTQSAYTLFFLEYYSRKADESLINFKSYMQNILKESLGLAQGFVNLTGGLYDAAEGKSGLISNTFTSWMKLNKGDNSYQRIGRNVLYIVIDGLRQGIKYGGESARYMAYLKELLGGLEQYMFGEAVNMKEAELEKTMLARFERYLKYSYLTEVESIVSNYTVSSNSVPQDINSNIKKAEATFTQNTEKHDYRNGLQYEWDVNTSAVNEFINVLKPALKMGLTAYLANPALANELVDAAGHAFNAMKVAAATNHTYEWYVLYREDLWDLNRSLNLLYKGSDLAWEEPVYTNTFAQTETISPFTANAAAPKITFTDIYYNILTSVENEDADALESALNDLEDLKKADSQSRSLSADLLVENFTEDSSEQDAYLDALNLNETFDFELDLMDLRLMTLAIDQSEETINAFQASITEFEQKEDELTEKTNQVLSSTAPQKATSKAGQQGDDTTFTIFFILAMLVFVAGLIKAIIYMKNHKLQSALIILGGAITLALLLFIIGSLFLPDETTPPAQTTELTQTTESTQTTPPAQTEEPSSNSTITNSTYGYSIEVGEEYANRFREIETEYEGTVADYQYCYSLDDKTYESFTCKTGEIPLFGITIYNQEQFEQYKNDPFFDEENLVGEGNGFYFFFGHPNGVLPEETFPITSKYDQIKSSFSI
ncbi:hypothetical protein KKC94_01200, partial [Patescibacteria group bacterium]|nr:hypothetical protein [Patescibacteria group bacterium]